MEAQEIVHQVYEIGTLTPIKETFNVFFWSLMGFNLIAIALIQTLNSGYMSTLFSVAIHNRQLINNLRENLNLSKFSAVLLNFTYFNALAVIVWMSLDGAANYFLLIIALGLTLGAVVKLIVIRLIWFVSNTKAGLLQHYLNHLIFFQIGGVILTPILIFTHYIPESYVNIVLIILITIVGLLVLVRELQSLTRALQYKVSIFYIILYLCTLELLPFVVSIRVFVLDTGTFN